MTAEPQIQKRTLGKTGYKATVLGFGGAYLNKEITKEDAVSVLHRAIDLGINYIDTAANYGGGLSEEYVGEVMKTRRKEVFIATKTDLRMKDESAEQINTSLRKLKTDCLDLIHPLCQYRRGVKESDIQKWIAFGGSGGEESWKDSIYRHHRSQLASTGCGFGSVSIRYCPVAFKRFGLFFL